MNKIILITSNIAPYRLLWCEELAKLFDVTIYYTKDKEKNYDDRFLKHSSNKCHIVKLNNKNDDTQNPICFDVIKVIKENINSLIIFDGYGPYTNLIGMVYAKLNKLKTFVSVDGYPTERKKKVFRDFVRKFVISNLCDVFFCAGENVKDYLIRYGAKKDNVCVHNFSSITDSMIIDKPLSHDEKIELRKKYGIETKGNMVIGVGRFVPLKRFEDLIEACKKLDVDLYLLGGKPTDKYLELVGNSTNIHFIDFVLPEDVFDYYKMANVFVLPSETDVWGLVVNEAMSQGLPVVVSDSVVAGYNMVKNNGVIFKTYDVNGLSEAIKTCLNDKTNKEMSINSLKIVKEFTIEGMVNRQLHIINKFFNI